MAPLEAAEFCPFLRTERRKLRTPALRAFPKHRSLSHRALGLMKNTNQGGLHNAPSPSNCRESWLVLDSPLLSLPWAISQRESLLVVSPTILS